MWTAEQAAWKRRVPGDHSFTPPTLAAAATASTRFCAIVAVPSSLARLHGQRDAQTGREK